MPDLISVLIVEDDRIILNDIVSMINWEKEGFTIVATATNGKLGCTAYKAHHPQLIITDIQMPFMDGLSMMRHIRAQDDAVSFLILSSFGEFEYAKEAVRLGTDSYLLKAEISPQLLADSLRPIREKLNSRQMVKSVTAQHKLFSLLYASVEMGDITPAPPEKISEAFQTYINSTHHDNKWLKQLEWIIRECYSILSITDRGAPCPDGEPAEVERWLLSEYKNIVQLRTFIYVRKYSPVIINACQYIEENYADPQLKISDVAGFVGLSSSRLSVLFKQETGKTINDYITYTRISAAKALLCSGKYKVYEVSDMVGYKTSQYFSQIFQQHVGSSPTDYLRRKYK